jgi:tetratricopeptide (TPR) repeat protein
LFKLFFPINISPIYVYPIKTEGILPLVYYASFIIVLGIAFLVYKFQKSKPYLLFGLVFFYVSLVFTFQILPSRLFIVADRYGYLANIGIFFILAQWFVEWKEGKINWLKDFSGKHYIPYIIGVAVLFLSFQQTSVWENNKTVANRIIETNPETSYLARAYGVKANYEKDILKNPEQALVDYEKAIELDSNDWVSPYQAGLLYQSLGDSTSAIRYFKLAIKAEKTSPMAFTDWGVLLSAQNQHSKALILADSALKRKPYFANALLLKAVSLLNLGNISDAQKNLNLCISKNPDFAPAYKNRGIVRLNNLNNKDGACSDFKKAAELGEPGMDQILKDYCN